MPVIPQTKPYRIGRAKTGLGLFATKPIKKGEKIIRYFGPLLDSKNKEHDAIENKYLFELNNRWTIDGSIRENVARYINHSCRPNAESDVKPRKRKIVIRAIKNIEPGEEINYDYGTDYFKAYLKPIGCKCEACEKKRAKKLAEAREVKAGKKAKDAQKGARKDKKAKAKADKSAGSKAKGKDKGKGVKAAGKVGKSANGKATPGKAKRVLNGAAERAKGPSKTSAKSQAKARSLNGLARAVA